MDLELNEGDVRVLAWLFWQIHHYMDTGVYVPVAVDDAAEAICVGQSVQKLQALEMIDSMEARAGSMKGVPIGVPNGRGSDCLSKHPGISTSVFQQFDRFAQKLMREQADAPNPRGRKRKRR